MPLAFRLQPSDLEVGAAMDTYLELVWAGWMEDSYRQRLLWVGLLSKALRVAKDPCRFVAHVVRRKAWHLVADNDLRTGERVFLGVGVAPPRPRAPETSWEALEPKVANLRAECEAILARIRTLQGLHEVE